MDAYEIRLTVLKMAQDLLLRDYETKLLILTTNANILASSIPKDLVPEIPTTNNIMDVAKDLYKFIENRKNI